MVRSHTLSIAGIDYQIMPLSQEQVKIIKATVPVLQQHGTDVTRLFYKNMLSERPELNNIFNQTNQVNDHQAGALAASLYAYATHIDDLGALSPAVEKICHKHASLYIQPEQYGIVGEGVLRAFATILGDAFTPEIHEAWAAAYWQLANIMIGREKQLYEESKGWSDWREFTIADKVKESDEITSFYLTPVDGQELPAYLPGQYISVQTNIPQFGHLQSRQYSLSDAPHPDYYRISVKRESGLDPQDATIHHHPGWISNILHDTKEPGSTLQISHPAGDFFYKPKTSSSSPTPIVLISAGVGITPMISILNTLLPHHQTTPHHHNKQEQEQEQESPLPPRPPITFFHSARTTTSRAFHSHMKSLTTQKPTDLRTTFYVKNLGPDDVVDRDYHHIGRLTIPKLAHTQRGDLWLDDAETEYFVCGPEGFMRDVRQGLKELGVDDERIKMEVFGTGMLEES
ncbi:Flavohemoprotein [Cercospora zeina]